MRRLACALTGALLLATFGTALAQLQFTPGLASITIIEVTGSPVNHTFAATAPQLNAQIVGLGIGNDDFNGLIDENYDAYYSTAAGNLDPNGDYLTIDCVFPRTTGGGGHNIQDVMLNFTNGPSVCACLVTAAIYSGPNSVAGSAGNAADCNPGTLSTMGSTASGGPPMKITLYFQCVVPNHQSTWGALKVRYQ